MKGIILNSEGHSKNKILYLTVLPSLNGDYYAYYYHYYYYYYHIIIIIIIIIIITTIKSSAYLIFLHLECAHGLTN